LGLLKKHDGYREKIGAEAYIKTGLFRDHRNGMMDPGMVDRGFTVLQVETSLTI
jgi:hypothetical protein